MATATRPPDGEEIDAAVAALPRLRDYLSSHAGAPLVRLSVAEDRSEVLALPRAAVELLASILGHMAVGQSVSIVPSHAELTTQQAADLLNVSRPFLIGLLDAGEIEYRLVGTHRRVQASSLMSYQRTDDARRRRDADALSAETYALGLTEPPAR